MDIRSTTQPRVFWAGSGPRACDCCGVALKDQFIDGATVAGPWAILRPDCHRTIGRGIERGIGQRYERQDDGRWLRIEG